MQILFLACTPFVNMEPIDYIPILNVAIEKKFNNVLC